MQVVRVRPVRVLQHLLRLPHELRPRERCAGGRRRRCRGQHLLHLCGLDVAHAVGRRGVVREEVYVTDVAKEQPLQHGRRADGLGRPLRPLVRGPQRLKTFAALAIAAAQSYMHGQPSARLTASLPQSSISLSQIAAPCSCGANTHLLDIVLYLHTQITSRRHMSVGLRGPGTYALGCVAAARYAVLLKISAPLVLRCVYACMHGDACMCGDITRPGAEGKKTKRGTHVHLEGHLEVHVGLGPRPGDRVVVEHPVADLVVAQAKAPHDGGAAAAGGRRERRRRAVRVARDVPRPHAPVGDEHRGQQLGEGAAEGVAGERHRACRNTRHLLCAALSAVAAYARACMRICAGAAMRSKWHPLALREHVSCKDEIGEAGSTAGATHKHTNATGTFGFVLCAHVWVIVEVTCRRGVR